MPETKKRVRALLTAAEAALAKGAADAKRHVDAADFKRFLLKHLEAHKAFAKAAGALHAHVHAMPVLPPKKTQTPRPLHPSGRVQAPRRDTPRGRGASGKKG